MVESTTEKRRRMQREADRRRQRRRTLARLLVTTALRSSRPVLGTVDAGTGSITVSRACCLARTPTRPKRRPLPRVPIVGTLEGAAAPK